MTFNCVLAGVGGQGAVLASKLVATAAMLQGLGVRTTETIGMAQRGGSVVSHIRAGDRIYSPLVPKGQAHALIAFDPAEASRQLHYLSANGTLITSGGDPDMEGFLRDHAQNVTIIGTKGLKARKTLNVALLGAAAQGGIFPFGAEALRAVIADMPRFREENLASFDWGRNAYHEYIGQN